MVRTFNLVDVNLLVNAERRDVAVWCIPTMTRFPGFATNGVYGTSNAIVLVLWEIRRPRNYVLTATLEF